MKKILLVVHPKWCKMIFNGKKTIEVRRNRPKLEPPFEVLVYETKGKTKYWSQPLPIPYTEGNGKVIGSFVCDRVFELKSNGDDYGNYWHEWDDEGDIQDMCLSYEELETYLGKSVGYGWHITEPKLFDKPKRLSEFYIPCKWYEKGNGCPEDCGLFDYEGHIDRADDFCEGKRPITRPPQSWAYIEEYNAN